MAPSGFGLSWLSIFVLASLLIAQTQALHLYLQEKQKKCFFEDLPKDTLVVGTWNSTFPLKIPILRPELGSYKVESLDLPTNTWIEDPTGQVLITVEETFDNDHRVVNQRTKRNGRFTFTAADAGQHRFCYTPLPGNTKGASDAPVKLTLDIAIGASSKIESEDSEKMASIVQRVRDLNNRMEDIRREQIYQRVSVVVLTF